ncbi:DUF5753 domain-containing protein [Kitasatospora sp. NPDC056446]|uniref:DUF5753 domain-containing protein n=1 Tax=Kitasatospora sp. NPDC056446 TaxID=3345819 RepID=UPI00369DCF2F
MTPFDTAEIASSRRTLATQYRSWRRQLAGGVRPMEETKAGRRRSFDPTTVPGLLQTADYARAVLTRCAGIDPSAGDVEGGVAERMERQRVLDDRSRSFHLLVWEGALVSRVCPPAVLADQLEALVPRLGAGNVRLGVVPFDADLRVPVGAGFSILDGGSVATGSVASGSWHEEARSGDAADVARYVRVWEALAEGAVYGPAAHRVIDRACLALREAY